VGETGQRSDLTVPNMALPGQPAPTFFAAYGEWMQSTLPTWDDLKWLREQWGGPFMLKGVMRVDDARRAPPGLLRRREGIARRPDVSGSRAAANERGRCRVTGRRGRRLTGLRPAALTDGGSGSAARRLKLPVALVSCFVCGEFVGGVMADDLFDVPTNNRQKRQQLPEEVATYVRGLIISGAVQPGEYLRMEPIADAVGVSNTPVREGLLALQSEGFVRLVPRRGFVVSPFTAQDVHDLFWAQAQLAGELAARAAHKITPEQLKRLVEVHKRHEEAMGAGDLERVSELGHEFHRHINRAADSYRLALLLRTIVKQLPSRFYVRIEGQLTDTRKQHRRLVAALRKRDADKARSVMEQHVLEGAEHLIEMLEERGVFATREHSAA
jgi:DNA-binding GntR family transcriptional regulator